MNPQASQIQSGFPTAAPIHKQQQHQAHGEPKRSQDRDEHSRGRRRSRDQTAEAGAKTDDGADIEGQRFDTPSAAPSRKRRRSRKGLDKKFECTFEKCDKSYSRAEHLYRHQLNHNPKQIFNCDYPECRRSFVRQDLCTRHKERHTARGSQLQRKDAFMQNMNPLPTSRSLNGGKDRDPFSPIPDVEIQHSDPNRHVSIKSDSSQYGLAGSAPLATFSPTSETSSTTMGGSNMSNTSVATDVKPQLQTQRPDTGGKNLHAKLDRSNSIQGDSNSQSYDMSSSPRNVRAPYDGHRPPAVSSMDTIQHQMQTQSDSSTTFVRPATQASITTPGMRDLSLSSPYSASSSAVPQTFLTHGPMHTGIHGSHQTVMPQTFPLFSLPPPGYQTQNQTTSPRASEAPFTTSPPATFSPMNRGLTGPVPTSSTGGSETPMIEPTVTPYSVPVFGGDEYSRSPFAMADDFAAWLFGDPQFNHTAPFNPTLSPMSRQGGPGGSSNFMSGSNVAYQPGYFVPQSTISSYYSHPMPPQHPMSIPNILDASLPETVLSDEKRKDLLDLIHERFNETDHAPVGKQKGMLLEGDQNDDTHVLSLKMMQTYIGSFWYHVHPQLPILHKPTFVADKTQNLLLIAMMAIGASCLDKAHGHEVTQAAAELSNFLAWHLRWEIFSDADFRPPAKLWVFQALLLLEIYEKMYSTRALHERAHIHHATTITLMRRGSSLIGKGVLESPPSVRDDKQGHAINGSSHTSGSPTTQDEWWNVWITNEATRRVAFAAFVTDSTHATMFGHSAVMVAHEMRLPLPCDEALWSATSSKEVSRVERILQESNVKQITFLDGLKRTLNAQSVRTNSFGRTILMAGLLSVSWHMNQRDLQVSSLGVSHALGGRDKWRSALTRSFDNWKKDFDQSLDELSDSDSGHFNYFNSMQDATVFESRTVLHHLAHMAMHVDIVDCQIYAGAGRLLGRAIGPSDYSSASRRMKDWAPTARARDATFYAVRFLSNVLLPEEHASQSVPGSMRDDINSEYSARDDFLLNRPWVLYFAALIIWSYGYALEGTLTAPVPALKTPQQKHRDMLAFLRKIGGVRTPLELSSLEGRNECVGLLLVLRDMFLMTRWELLHEAANLLTTCAETLVGSSFSSW